MSFDKDERSFHRSISVSDTTADDHSEKTFKTPNKSCAKKDNASPAKARLSRFKNLSPNTSKSPIIMRKRRHTISGWHDIATSSKRRRVDNVAFPTKFLLGGNISDPLNLKSLEDEEVNRKLNAFSPASSPPKPSRQRNCISILIPQNIYDPLNLTCEESDDSISFLLKCKKRKHKRPASKKENTDIDKSTTVCDTKTTKFSDSKQVKAVAAATTTGSDPSQLKESGISHAEEVPVTSSVETVLQQEVSVKEQGEKTPAPRTPLKISVDERPKRCSEERSKLDKIVSPVVPQGSRFFNRRYSQSSSSSKGEQRKNNICYQAFLRYNRTNVNSLYFYGSKPPRFHCSKAQDIRFKFFDESWFANKDVLDIGCNIGCVPALIAQYYHPRRVTAIDINSRVVEAAKQHILRHYNKMLQKQEKFPISFALSLGPIHRTWYEKIQSVDDTMFPNNVSFKQENYVFVSDESNFHEAEYDVILCLRVTKWIHLNFGDDGLKRAFRRMFAQLKSGGQLILEPQPWPSYKRSKNITEWLCKNYENIQFKPEMFREFLLKEVGFSECKVIGRLVSNKRGYIQTLYVFTKNDDFCPLLNTLQCTDMSPIVFNDIEWGNPFCGDETRSSEWNFGSENALMEHDGLSEEEDDDYRLCGDSETLMEDTYLIPSIEDLYDL